MRRSLSFSPRGKETVFHGEVRMAITGEKILELDLLNYSLEGVILERISRFMLLSKRRFSVILDNGNTVQNALHAFVKRQRTIAEVFQFKQLATLSVTILPVACSFCSAVCNFESDGFRTRFTPERWQLACNCEPHNLYLREYGWTALRKWHYLVRKKTLK